MEKWLQLESAKHVTGTFYLDTKKWLHKGLYLKLSSQELRKDIEVLCNGHIGSFSYTDESLCFGIFSNLKEQYGQDFFINKTFFKIENSDFLKKISRLRYTDQDISKFAHYSILGGDEVIDIITDIEPQIKIINK